MAPLNFESDDDFEFVMILSLLSRKPVTISHLSNVENKIEFLEFLKCISPELNYQIAANSLDFTPGALIGGKQCKNTSSICQFLKPIILLSPFLKDDLVLQCNGTTNDSESVDSYKITFYSIFKLFRIPGFEINIKKRGFPPEGDGIVVFKSQAVKCLENVELEDAEKILKIRGMVISARISSDTSHRLIKEIKNRMGDLANTKVLCIVNNRNDSGPSPGFECSVFAESKNGVFYNTRSSALHSGETPEKMAKKCCFLLLKNIQSGGIFDVKLMPSIILYMGLAVSVGNIRIGVLDEQSKRMLKLMNQFFGVEHRVVSSGEEQVLSIVGCGYKNPFRPL